MEDSQRLPDGTDDLHTFLKARIVADGRAAKRERDANAKRAEMEDSVWEGGRLVPRKH